MSEPTVRVSETSPLRAVSLFSNCGAGDLGYRLAGFRFDVMAELVSYRLDVALLNHRKAKGVPGDLRETLPQVIEKWRQANRNRRPALLAACPPCQGMSSARGGRGKAADAEAGSRDERNLLVQVIIEAVAQLRPRAVVIENVPAFLTRKVLDPATQLPTSAAVLVLRALESDYEIYPLVADLADYGVPQTRKRSFLTFIRRDEPGTKLLDKLQMTPYPAPTTSAPVTIEQALAALRLPALDAASAETAVDADRPLHAVPVWSEDRYAMVAATSGKAGGSCWDNEACRTCGPVHVGRDDVSCPSCSGPLLRPVVVEANGTVRFVKGFRASSYRRMRPDRPARTITTASGHLGSDNTLHPSQNRVLSALECAALQTFPDGFRWGDVLKERGHTNVREMIGEAVPPAFTRQHGRVLAALLRGRRPTLLLENDDDRAARARDLLGMPSPTH